MPVDDNPAIEIGGRKQIGHFRSSVSFSVFLQVTHSMGGDYSRTPAPGSGAFLTSPGGLARLRSFRSHRVPA